MVDGNERVASKARRFIASGATEGIEHELLANACNQLIRMEAQRSPRSAVRKAKKFVRQATPLGGVLLQTSLRAQGRAFHALGRYADARDSYLVARKLVLREPAVRALIDLTLIDVFMYLREFSEATKRYRSALATFERLGDKVQVARTRVNFANLLHRQDRHLEASRQYRKAIAVLESLGDELSLAVCRYNLANTMVQALDFRTATELYIKAEQGFARLDYDLYANECRYGLAWLRMLHGDYHSALTGLADCEIHYERASQTKGVLLCQLDRAEIYLALNLLTDARDAARSAEKKATRLGLQYEAAKAALFLARASQAIGDRPAARKALKRATEAFRAERNQPFLGVVGLTSALASLGGPSKRTAIKNARMRFARAQLPLWEAISDLEYLSVVPDDAAARRRLGRNPAVKVVPHLFASWHTILGDRQQRAGRVAAARRHWTKAVEMLEVIRLKLPPTEVRSLLSRQHNDPYLRLVDSLCARKPSEAAAWTERRRTAGLWTPLSREASSSDARSSAEESLSQLAQALSSLSVQIGPETGHRATAEAKRIRRLEGVQRQVRSHLARLEPDTGRRTPLQEEILAEFRAVSEGHPVVQFHCQKQDLVVFVHSKGDTRSHRYCGGRRVLRQHFNFWQLLLSRAVNSRTRTRRSDLDDERRLFAELGEWLCEPLADILSGEELLILPEGELANLPWHALVVNKKPLIEITGVMLAPSLRHYLQSHKRHVDSNRIDVFVGQTEGLPNCHEELAVFRGRPKWKVAIHEECSRQDWPDQAESGIWHYLGHARFRSDNPFYSSLQMADGPLFAADFRLRQNKVGLITLAACRTGRQTFVPGEESTGLVRSLLEMGARNVIASHWAIADESASLWMRTFYSSYLKDLTLHKSIQQAALAVREKYPSAYHWAAFALFGAGLNKTE